MPYASLEAALRCSCPAGSCAARSSHPRQIAASDPASAPGSSRALRHADAAQASKGSVLAHFDAVLAFLRALGECVLSANRSAIRFKSSKSFAARKYKTG